MKNRLVLLVAGFLSAATGTNASGIEKSDPFKTINAPDPIAVIHNPQEYYKVIERQISGDGFDYDGGIGAAVAEANLKLALAGSRVRLGFKMPKGFVMPPIEPQGLS